MAEISHAQGIADLIYEGRIMLQANTCSAQYTDENKPATDECHTFAGKASKR